MSGQDLGYDIGDTPFYREVLKAELVADDSGSRSLSGLGGTYTLNTGDGLPDQYYPSSVQPLSGAEALLGWTTAGAVSAQNVVDSRPERVKEKNQGKGKGKAKGNDKKNNQPQVQAQSVAQGAGGVLASFGAGRVAYLSFGLEALPSAERSRLLQELFNRLLR